MPRGNLSKTVKPESDDDAVILSVALVSGRFESSITVPLHCTDAERKGFIDAWLNLMDAGVKAGKEHRDLKSSTETQDAVGKSNPK
jgi:hypothetical protein